LVICGADPDTDQDLAFLTNADPDTDQDLEFLPNADPDSGQSWAKFAEGKQKEFFFSYKFSHIKQFLTKF
jgi:hypothetical protein